MAPSRPAGPAGVTAIATGIAYGDKCCPIDDNYPRMCRGYIDTLSTMNQHIASDPEQFLTRLNAAIDAYLQRHEGRRPEGTKTWLAQQLVCDRTTLYKYLDGTNRIPLDTLQSLIRLIGLGGDETNALLFLSGYGVAVPVVVSPPPTLNVIEPTDLRTALQEALTKSLPAALDNALSDQLSLLTGLLSDFHKGQLSEEDLTQALTSEAMLSDLLLMLAGQEVAVRNRLISFGSGTQTGDVTFRDVAGNNIFNITLQIQVPPSPPTTTGTAPPMPALMIGRDSDLAKLKQRVGIGAPDQQVGSIKVLTAMRGWPGVGKTTLAAALAHDPEVSAHFPDGVLWASLGQQPNLFAELGNWGRALGVPDLYGAKTVEEASQLLAGLLRTKSALLIVDDVWEAEHLLPFRIGGGRCAMLLTTRLPEVANAIAATPVDVYLLRVLDAADALDLLRRLAPTVVAANETVCRELVDDLEGLPLALQVAGRLLHTKANYGFKVNNLLQKLRQGAALIAAQAPKDRADIANQTTPTVAALLDLSTSQLDETSLTYFAYLGVFAPKPATFDMAALHSVWQVDDPEPMLQTLINLGLLEPTDSRYWMHAILVAHAKSFWAKGDEQ